MPPDMKILEQNAAAAQQALDTARRRLSGARDSVMTAHEERGRVFLAGLDDRSSSARAALTAADSKVAELLRALDSARSSLGV